MTHRFISRPLDRKDDRAGFSCGNERIDRAFHTTVSQDVKRDFATCFVAIDRDTGVLAGFYTLSSWVFSIAELPERERKRLPRYPQVPAILLGWLGRDLRYAGTGVGSYLLFDALARVLRLQTDVYAVIAHTIDNDAVRFYERYGFRPFPKDPMSLLITVAEVRDMMEALSTSVD